MLKVHIYHGNGKSATIRSEKLGLTILRQDSVQDKEGRKSPKGRQHAMIEVTESDGELILTSVRTGERISI